MNEQLWIYDISLDEKRPATQQDIDRLQHVAMAYYLLRKELQTTNLMAQSMQEIHEEMRAATMQGI